MYVQYKEFAIKKTKDTQTWCYDNEMFLGKSCQSLLWCSKYTQLWIIGKKREQISYMSKGHLISHVYLCACNIVKLPNVAIHFIKPTWFAYKRWLCNTVTFICMDDVNDRPYKKYLLLQQNIFSPHSRQKNVYSPILLEFLQVWSIPLRTLQH